jgi:hypothetical protein
MLVGIRPSDSAYVNHTGADFVSQGDTITSPTNNLSLYEINNVGDQIDFDLVDRITGLGTPIMVVNTIFGTTEFDLIDRDNGNEILGETSGFDSDVWIINLSGTEGNLRLTNFDDQQAAFYPYIRISDLID